jgi:predicted ester cyclase
LLRYAVTLLRKEWDVNEAAKATAIRFFEEQDRFRGGPPDDLCADDYIAYLGGAPAMDLEGHRAFAAPFYGGIPDLEHRIEEVIAEGDRVAVRFRLAGTNSRSLMGQPPSGTRIDAGALALMRIRSGRVAEIHAEFDRLGLMQQIGALPSESAAVGY